jgi:hypothetical protein
LTIKRIKKGTNPKDEQRNKKTVAEKPKPNREAYRTKFAINLQSKKGEENMKTQLHVQFVVTCGVADVQNGFQITVAQIVVLAASNDKCIVQRAGVVTHDGVLGRIQQHSVQASILSIANARMAPNKHNESQNGG